MGWTNEVFQIKDNLYCIKDVHSVNKYLIIGSEKALLFDTGYGFVDFRPIIREITDKQLIVVNSHTDADHMLGNYLFDEVYISKYDYKNLQVNEQPELKKQQLEYRLQKSKGRLEKEMEEEIGNPENWLQHSVYTPQYHLIDDGYLFELGNLRLETISMPGHTSGSIALLEEKNGWLFTGDSVMEYNVFYIPAGNPPRYPEPMMVYYHSLMRLKRRIDEIKAVFPGHGAYDITTDIIDETLQNVREIHDGTGHFENIVTYRGAPAIKNAVGKSLIYFNDDYARPFRKCKLIEMRNEKI